MPNKGEKKLKQICKTYIKGLALFKKAPKKT